MKKDDWNVRMRNFMEDYWSKCGSSDPVIYKLSLGDGVYDVF